MRPFIPFILALAACDPIPPPDAPPPPPAGCGLDTQMFGSCGVGLTCADETLGCVEVDEGAVCLPVQGEPSPDVLACAANVGPLACSVEFNLCGVVCRSGHDSECKVGMVCDDQTHLCVWPGDVPPWHGTTGEPQPGNTNPTTTTSATE